MPPPARHQLALLVLPAEPDGPLDRGSALMAAWRAAGFALGPGPGHPLVEGGCAAARACAAPAARFLANRQGGFRVRCPATGANAVPAFSRALEAWRRGGPRRLACDCGATHDLNALDFAPPAGFARSWVEVVDAASPVLLPEAARIVEEVWGESRVVWRRG